MYRDEMPDWSETYPVNVRKAMEVADGDIDFLIELADIYFQHFPEQNRELHRAIERQDGKSVKFWAHRLLGGMRNFGADTACGRAYEVEKAGEQEKFCLAAKLHIQLEKEIEVLRNYFTERAWERFLHNV